MAVIDAEAEVLRPISGPTCWTGPELSAADGWWVALDDAARRALVGAATACRDQETTAITAADFPLGAAATAIARIRDEVMRGRGVALLRTGAEDLDEPTAHRVVWGIGQHLGVPQIQDAAGTLLHDVRDVGADPDKQHNVRIYQTNRAQTFHNDGGDMFALFCRRRGARGGGSMIASAHRLWNEILNRDPDLALALTEPFYFDARGQSLPGRPWFQKMPIYHFHQGNAFIIHKRPYIEFAQRDPEIPRLTGRQVAALDLLDDLCDDPAFHIAFDLEPGDMILANNFATLHARAAFEDQGADTAEKRHMIRLWLGADDGVALPPFYAETREFGPLFQTTRKS